MSAVTVRPETLQHVCKEPLDSVRSVQLRGRGITRLVGLDVCRQLTSLDISWNALTELDSARFEGCRGLWFVDVSNNRLGSLGGLFSFMALGYLNLSGNPLPLENLRPLGHAHVLELFLGNNRSAQERRLTLGMLPNLWVLDNEFVSAEERCTAEDDHSPGGREANGHHLNALNDSLLRQKPTQSRPSVGRDYAQSSVNHSSSVNIGLLSSGSGCGGLESLGDQAREFYENVLWKLPSRTSAAETFRLATLLERYDQRAAITNKSAWLRSFTRRGISGGARGSVRRDWALPLPRPHLKALLSLPLELKLDVAVLLTVLATFRDSIPQQVLAEAFMILLLTQGGLPDFIHDDLSRMPNFICTALVHNLRSSMLHQLDQHSMPGQIDTTAPPLFDRQQADLLDAIPPVVTGIDFQNAFDNWEITSRNAKGLARREGGQESKPAGDIGSNKAAMGNTSQELQPTGEVSSTPSAGDAAQGAVFESCGRPVSSTSSHLEAYKPPHGIGLTLLCRRTVILLTRSPSCPDLVAWQTDPATQRTYDEMEPLLARANMAYRDLHPTSSFGDERSDFGTSVQVGGNLDWPLREYSPSTPTLQLDTSSPVDKSDGRDRSSYDHQQQSTSHEQDTSLVESIRLPDAGFWSAAIRRPRAGERVQVFHDKWSIILAVDPDEFSVVVAPFEGIQAPPYRGQSHVDPRDLCYDPRGWWRHAAALTTNVSIGTARLHRLGRGLSTSGLPWGAGSLNEPLEEDLLLNRGTRQNTPMALAGAVFAYERRVPTVAPRPSTTKPGTTHALATSLAPVVLRQDRHSKNNVVDVFSAEGSWDPVFVVAPPRLVGLQNQTAARKIGPRRARQVAWHRIDGPEVSIAPHPMMPRCSSLPASAERKTECPPFLQQPPAKPLNLWLSTQRSPPRSAVGVPSHPGDRATARFTPSRSLSVPSISKPDCCSKSTVDTTAVTNDNAWLELQREMGSLKADNQMSLRCSRWTNTCSPPTSGSAVSVSTSPAENTRVCSETTADMLAETLSLRLDGPEPVWKGGRPGDPITTVFELTQVGGGCPKNSESIALGTVGESGTNKLQVGSQQQGAAFERSTERGGERNVVPHDGPKPFGGRQGSRRDGDQSTNITKCPKWKPHVNRPLEWFPVPGRQLFLVDPNDVQAATASATATVSASASASATALGTVSATASATARIAEPAAETVAETVAETAAVAETAIQATQCSFSDDVDVKREEMRAAGSAVDDESLDIQRVHGDGHADHHATGRERPHHDGEGEQQRSKNMESSGQGVGRSEREYGSHVASARSELSLSTRSAFPSAAVLVDLSPASKTTRVGARAATTSWAGNRRARPYAGFAASGGGSKVPNHARLLRNSASKSCAPLEVVANHSTQKRYAVGTAQIRGKNPTSGGYHRDDCPREQTGNGPPWIYSAPSKWIGQGRERGGGKGGRSGGARGVGDQLVNPEVLTPHQYTCKQGAAVAGTTSVKNGGGRIQTSRLCRPKARGVSAPRPTREKRAPSREIPQEEQRGMMFGWESENASVVAGEHGDSGLSCDGLPPAGHGVQHVLNKQPRGSSPAGGTLLDECTSTCSTIL